MPKIGRSRLKSAHPQSETHEELPVQSEHSQLEQPVNANFTNLLAHQHVASPQKQSVVQNIARTYGNKGVQRVLAQTKPQPVQRASSQPLVSVVQRFDSFEHQSLGNGATGNAQVNLGGTEPGQQFELLHGDLVALSGDYFLTDDLIRLAAIPGNNGLAAGTRDEVIYALHEMDKDRLQDTRFKAGGIWNKLTFSKEVIAAVESRYSKLAAANNAHFVAPFGRDKQGQPIAASGGGGYADASYRSNHERALLAAYQAGQKGSPIDKAIAYEACGQHYLTDAFSAGHARTPVGLMREYWQAKYPLFWYNFLHKLALDTATAMNDQSAAVTYVVSVQMLYERIMAQVNQIASTLPEINLGDLVSKVFHDYDNEHGVEIEGGGKIYGDDHLDDADPHNVTRGLAQTAIQAGNKEVNTAYTLGQSQASAQALDEAVLHSTIRQGSGSGDNYAAETMIPKLASTNPAQQWQAPSFEALWSQPVVAGSKDTFGSLLTASFQPGKEVRQQLDGLAAKFPTAQLGMNPQAAYLKGFLNPLSADLYKGILNVINWAPNYGLDYTDKDDVSLETGQDLDKHKALSGMTTPARTNYVKELVEGWVASDEEDMIVRIFETAPANERPLIYKGVEGHNWNGDFKHGMDIPVVSSGDALWKKLDNSRRDRLRKLINGQAVGK